MKRHLLILAFIALSFFVSAQNIGVASFRLAEFDEGKYMIEARKEGHRTIKESLTLAKQEQETLTLNTPQPVYGKLKLDSSPSNCDVYLDGKQIGKSPNVFSDILIGDHNIELRKNGYDSQSQPVSIEEGRITDLSLTLQRTGSVAQQPEVQQPLPLQSEKPTVQNDKKKNFHYGKNKRRKY